MTRRHDLDWLRVVAVFMLVPYHSSRIFDTWEPFYVKNAAASVALTGIRAVLDPWGMPLLFLLSGAGSWLALRHRTGAQYLRERVLRLVVPLMVGLIVIVPPQAYLAWLSRGHAGGYWGFLREYWGLRTGELLGWTGGFTVGHLWFIVFLFVFSLVALPAFLFLRGPTGRRAVAWLARLAEKPGAILLFIVPLWATEPLPGPVVGPVNPFTYLLLFVGGYVLLADGRFQVGLDRTWRGAVALGAIALAGLVALRFGGVRLADGSWQSSVRDFLLFATIWGWLVGALGFAHIRLDRPSRHLSYLTAAAYPFYILHQTVILAIGYVVVGWHAGVLLKFLVVAVGSAAATLALCELARRWSVTRVVLGVKAVSARAG